MKKTLSILLAIAMVIGSFPVFADDAKADASKKEEKAVVKEVKTGQEALDELLKFNGVVKGEEKNGKIDYKIGAKLTRQEAIIFLCRLKGEAAQAEGYDKKDGFKDVKNSYWAPIVTYAKAKGYTDGVGGGKFNPLGEVTAQEFAAMLLRGLGYEDETKGDNYKNTLGLAKELGLFPADMTDKTVLKRDAVYMAMYKTLETPKKGGTDALKYELGLAKKEDKEDKEEKEEKEVSGDLKVDSVETNGLKQIIVTFGQKPDSKTIKKIKVKDGVRTQKKEAFLVSDTEVIVVLDKEAKQNASYDVIIEDVKAENGEAFEKFEEKVEFLDKTLPEGLELKVEDARTLVLEASEALNVASTGKGKYKTSQNFKVDGKKLSLNVANNGTNTIKLTFKKPLKVGEHKLSVVDVKDYAGLPLVNYKGDFTIEEDKDAPKMIEAKVLANNMIVVKFDENLDVENGIGKYRVNGKNVKSQEFYEEPEDHTNYDMVKLTLNDADKLDSAATAEVEVQYKDQKDASQNAVKSFTTFVFTTDDDTELPTVEVKEVKQGKTNGAVVLKFSKSMKTSVGTVKVKKVDGKKATQTLGQAKWMKSNTELQVEGTKLNGNGHEVEIELEGFQDASIRENKMPITTLTFSTADQKKPEFQTVKYDKDQNALILYFSEELEVETAEKAISYNFLANSTTTVATRLDELDFESEIEVDGDTVVITFEANKEAPANKKDSKGFPSFKTDGTAACFTTDTHVRVSYLKDLAGNEIVTTKKAITQPAGTIQIKDATLMKDAEYGNVIKVTTTNAFVDVEDDTFFIQASTHASATTNLAGDKVVASVEDVNYEDQYILLALPSEFDTNGVNSKVSGAKGCVVGFNENKHISGKSENFGMSGSLARVTDKLAPVCLYDDVDVVPGAKNSTVACVVVIPVSEELAAIANQGTIAIYNDEETELLGKLATSTNLNATIADKTATCAATNITATTFNVEQSGNKLYVVLGSGMVKDEKAEDDAKNVLVSNGNYKIVLANIVAANGDPTDGGKAVIEFSPVPMTK